MLEKNLSIVVKGESAHGSTPHLGHDAIVAACMILLNLQTFISRRNDARKPVVLNIGSMNGGKAINIICDRVDMEGILRVSQPEQYEWVRQELNQIVEYTAKTFHCGAELSFQNPVQNRQV